jgi:hypothetical protein
LYSTYKTPPAALGACLIGLAGTFDTRHFVVTVHPALHPHRATRKQALVLTPVSRMGPPPRSFAADAHDCIMVRSLWTYRIQGCGAMIRARWQAPL